MAHIRYKSGVYFVERADVVLALTDLEYRVNLSVREGVKGRGLFILNISLADNANGYTHNMITNVVSKIVCSGAKLAFDLEELSKDIEKDPRIKKVWIETTIEGTQLINDYRYNLAELPLINRPLTRSTQEVLKITSIDMNRIVIKSQVDKVANTLEFTITDGQNKKATLGYSLQDLKLLKDHPLQNEHPNKRYKLESTNGKTSLEDLLKEVEDNLKGLMLLTYKNGAPLREADLVALGVRVIEKFGLRVFTVY